MSYIIHAHCWFSLDFMLHAYWATKCKYKLICLILEVLCDPLMVLHLPYITCSSRSRFWIRWVSSCTRAFWPSTYPRFCCLKWRKHNATWQEKVTCEKWIYQCMQSQCLKGSILSWPKMCLKTLWGPTCKIKHVTVRFDK